MKPKLFIGSSVEGIEIARAIRRELEYDFEIQIWNDGVFNLTNSTLDDLLNYNCDFAGFVFAKDDELKKKKILAPTVRDNVLFEFGLFLGKLGKQRVSFVAPRDETFHLPTDINGITHGTFEIYDGGKINVGTYCDNIRKQKEIWKINFPDLSERYGKNILSDKVLKIWKCGSIYAEIPDFRHLMIKIKNLSGEDKTWALEAGNANWRIMREKEPLERNEQYIEPMKPISEGNFIVNEDSDIEIQFFEDRSNSPFKTKKIRIERD